MAFPTSPTNGDLHTEFGRSYQYVADTNSWQAATTPAPVNTNSTVTTFQTATDLPLVNNNPGDTTFVAENNSFRLWTGNGWFEIALANTAPTITAGANASYTLNSDGTPTVITMAATDPEGTPIIWGYQVTSGSLEDTTVTNDGGVFTITPGTVDATFDLTFTASDGINIDTSASSLTLSFPKPDWSTTTLLHTIDNPTAYGTSDGDRIGRSGSLSASGNYAIVGAYLEDDAGGEDSGKAYIFNVTTGALVHTLDNPNAFGTSGQDYFGSSVAISDNYAIVGALQEGDADATESGKAYIFKTTTGDWTDTVLVHTLDNPHTYGIGGGFGSDVCIDGDYAAVSNPYSSGSDVVNETQSGMVWIYNIITGALTYTIDNPNVRGVKASDKFGSSIAMEGNYLVVGAPGEKGTNNNSYVGATHIFKTTTGDWSDTTLLHTLFAPTINQTYDGFGETVDISGNKVAVRSSGYPSGTYSGIVRVYDVVTGQLVSTASNPRFNGAYGTNDNDQFGEGLKLSGNILAVGAPFDDDATGTNSGKVHIFNVSTSTASKIITIDDPNAYATTGGDYFGQAVAISDGFLISSAPEERDAGGYYSGKVYVFEAQIV
jgi:hypothetical protein